MKDITKSSEIIFVEDNIQQAERIQNALQGKGFPTIWFRTGAEALKAFNQNPKNWRAVILDLELMAPGEVELQGKYKETPKQRIAGFYFLRELIRAGYKGSAAFLTNYFEFREYLSDPEWKEIAKIRVFDKSNYGTHQLAVELVRELEPDVWRFRQRLLAGVMLEELQDLAPLLAELKKLAYLDQHVLLHGEPGVGKEALARYYCVHSGRRGQFVVVNAGDLMGEAMLVSLNGRAKDFPQIGVREQPGAFELAGYGVVYFSDLDKYTASTDRQLTPLLYAMDGMNITRVGANTPIEVRSVIVASVNEPNLLAEPIRGRFRHHIRIPPLRERPADVAVLARFLRQRSIEQHAILGLSADVSKEEIEALIATGLHDNIRDLEYWALTNNIPNKRVKTNKSNFKLQELPFTLNITLDSQKRALYSQLFGHRGRVVEAYWTWLVHDLGLNFSELKWTSGLREREIIQWLQKFGLVVPGMPDSDEATDDTSGR